MVDCDRLEICNILLFMCAVLRVVARLEHYLVFYVYLGRFKSLCTIIIY